MWTRAQLKSDAKKSLSKNFIYTVGVYIGYLVLTLQIFDIYVNVRDVFESFNGTTLPAETLTVPFIPFTVDKLWVIQLGILFLLLWIGFLLYHIFIVYPLKVGYYRYYIVNRHEPAKFSELFTIFKTHEYMNVVKISLITDIKIVLWTLCFIIPGLIKTYEYSMIPYILSENPGIDRKRVFDLTYEMTYGEKMEMLFLNLSFIGWILLGTITVIGILFVDIYIDATATELYAVLKDKVLNSDFATELDFQA